MSSIRAVALYRTSNIKQTGETNDLPKQRNIVREYIWNKNYDLIREFTEGGVSGFSNNSLARDKLQFIMKMARQGEFDVLVIHHSSRLGRLANDTCTVVKELNNNGVKIESTIEGVISTETQADELSTYLKYLQGESESITKSEIIADYHRDMVKEGRFRGGNLIPLGYKLVDNGNRNYKDRHILDFAIDEDEAKVVRLIYSLSIDEGYGQQRIAQYLNKNGYKSKKGGPFHSSSIQSVLANPIYKGQFRLNSKKEERQILSSVRADLIIIPPERWDLQRRISNSRIFNKKTSYIEKDNRGKSKDGMMLLSGIAKCGHCGMSLTTQTIYKTWTTSDGAKHKTKSNRYRCSSFYASGGVICSGQATYSKNKIEPVVIARLNEFITNLQDRKLYQCYISNFKNTSLKLKHDRHLLEESIKSDYLQLKTLKEEVVKLTIGCSKFEPDLLSALIEKKNNEVMVKELSLINLEEELNELIKEESRHNELSMISAEWLDRFDAAEVDIKKSMLAEFVDSVIVFIDRIEIAFNETVINFMKNSSKQHIAR